MDSIHVFHQCIEKEQRSVFETIFKKSPDIVNEQNRKGETALHIACKHPKVNALTSRILQHVSDENVRNYWAQCPLHYAAEANSVETMKLLLHLPGINATCKDVNGYTALHSFVVSSKTFDENWAEGFKLLVDANIDLNSQTNYGQSILHLASFQEENTAFLEHMVSKYHDLDLKATNKADENFLHIYLKTHMISECSSVLEVTGTISMTILQKLLNQQDVSGSTPWCLMLENGDMTWEHFQAIVENYGIALDTPDNLGNTAMMRRVGKYGSDMDDNVEIYKLMMKNGINVNYRNVFGQSAASLLYSGDVYEVLSQGGLDLTTPDRWGRIPLINVMNQNANPATLEMMIESHMINSNDVNGSTPLHVAAYLGTDDYIKLLLKHGADKESRDVIRDTPLDTARRHGNSTCLKLLAGEMQLGPVNESHYKIPDEPLKLTSLYNFPIYELLTGFPRHIETYAESALNMKYNGDKTSDTKTEVHEIIEAVNTHVRRICEFVSMYDNRFRVSVFNTGSTAEGTKVGAPDEFDFALCIDSLKDVCEIETSASSSNYGYARLKYKSNLDLDEYMPFSDMDQYFLALPFLHYLFRYIKRALDERQLWQNGNLYTRSEERIRVINMKPVFNYDIYWIGRNYKHLKISIDLVPAVYQRGWWPKYAELDGIKLMNENVKAAGCFILMQTEENSFDSRWRRMNDSVSSTCTFSDENETTRQLQISIAPAEIALMKSLPEVFRQGYALAKIVKSSDICPEVKIDIRPLTIGPIVYARLEKSHPLFSPPVNPSANLKSYWLKNCLFYIAEEMGPQLSRNTTPLQLTHLIYQKLLDFAWSWNFMPYVLPLRDLFGLPEKTRDFTAFTFRRMVAICTVLAVLGRPIPPDIAKWIYTCEKNYASLNRSMTKPS